MGAAATSRVSLPLHPSRSATCFYQYGADPQGLPQVGSVLLLSGQPPLRHLEMISHHLHSPCALTTPAGWAGGVGREGPSAGKTPQVFSQRATLRGHPDSPRRQPPKAASPPTHSPELCEEYIPRARTSPERRPLRWKLVNPPPVHSEKEGFHRLPEQWGPGPHTVEETPSAPALSPGLAADVSP